MEKIEAFNSIMTTTRAVRICVLAVMICALGCPVAQGRVDWERINAADARRTEVRKLWGRLKVGMSPEDVKITVGEPSSVWQDETGETWNYSGGGRVSFEGGKLTEWLVPDMRDDKDAPWW